MLEQSFEVNPRCSFHNERSGVNVLMLTTADPDATGRTR